MIGYDFRGEFPSVVLPTFAKKVVKNVCNVFRVVNRIVPILDFSKDFFSSPRFGGYFNLLLGKPLIRYMHLTNRIDLVTEKIKLAISVQITTANRREIKVRYFVNKSFLSEIRIAMLVTPVKSGIIYFKIFNDNKLWEMVRYFGD